MAGERIGFGRSSYNSSEAASAGAAGTPDISDQQNHFAGTAVRTPSRLSWRKLTGYLAKVWGRDVESKVTGCVRVGERS